MLNVGFVSAIASVELIASTRTAPEPRIRLIVIATSSKALSSTAAERL
jgi:hypothetical protein